MNQENEDWFIKKRSATKPLSITLRRSISEGRTLSRCITPAPKKQTTQHAKAKATTIKTVQNSSSPKQRKAPTKRTTVEEKLRKELEETKSQVHQLVQKVDNLEKKLKKTCIKLRRSKSEVPNARNDFPRRLSMPKLTPIPLNARTVPLPTQYKTEISDEINDNAVDDNNNDIDITESGDNNIENLKQCQTCFSSEQQDQNHGVTCDKCHDWHHNKCISLDDQVGKWYCKKCFKKPDNNNIENLKQCQTCFSSEEQDQNHGGTCDKCHDWHHNKCISLDDQVGNSKWYCKKCIKKRPAERQLCDAELIINPLFKKRATTCKGNMTCYN